jgi:hypothetical protein
MSIAKSFAHNLLIDQRISCISISSSPIPSSSNLSHSTIAFICLKQLWMDIWQHTHTITTTEVSPDLGEFAEIIDDVSVEMIPLRYH